MRSYEMPHKSSWLVGVSADVTSSKTLSESFIMPYDTILCKQFSSSSRVNIFPFSGYTFKNSSISLQGVHFLMCPNFLVIFPYLFSSLHCHPDIRYFHVFCSIFITSVTVCIPRSIFGNEFLCLLSYKHSELYKNAGVVNHLHS